MNEEIKRLFMRLVVRMLIGISITLGTNLTLVDEGYSFLRITAKEDK